MTPENRIGLWFYAGEDIVIPVIEEDSNLVTFVVVDEEDDDYNEYSSASGIKVA